MTSEWVYVVESREAAGMVSVVAVIGEIENVQPFVDGWQDKYPESVCNVTEHEVN